jgi:hypothetical protein
MSGSEALEECENIDQTSWVPQGSEVVPAAAFLNGYAKAEGKRFVSCDTPIIDMLLDAGRIDASHHDTALRLIKLFRSGTSKQGFATMQIFSSSRGFDSSDYCPITLFIRATRDLKVSQMYWIRVICGIQKTSSRNIMCNADIIKDSLKQVEEKLHQNHINNDDYDAPCEEMY